MIRIHCHFSADGAIIQMLRRRLITFPFDCLEAAWGAQAESFKVLSGQKRPTKEFVYVVPLLCMSFLIMCCARRSNVFFLRRHRRAPRSSRCDDALPVDTQRRGYTGNANLLFLPRRRRDEDYACIIITRDDELWLLTLSFIFNSLGTVDEDARGKSWRRRRRRKLSPTLVFCQPLWNPACHPGGREMTREKEK